MPEKQATPGGEPGKKGVPGIVVSARRSPLFSMITRAKREGSMPRAWSTLMVVLSFLGLPFPRMVHAICGPCSSDGSVSSFLCPGPENVDTGNGCGGFPSCQTPVLSGPFLDFFPEPDGQFTVRLQVEVTAPRNHEQTSSALWPQVFWYAGDSAPPPGSANACLFGPYDKASTYIQRQNVTCAGGDFGTFSMRAVSCSCAAPALLTGMRFQVAAGSPPGCGGPPPSRCPEDESCSLCLGPGGSASPGGGGPGLGPPGSGPGARLRDAAGGAGFPGWPAAPPGLPSWGEDGATTMPSASSPIRTTRACGSSRNTAPSANSRASRAGSTPPSGRAMSTASSPGSPLAGN